MAFKPRPISSESNLTQLLKHIGNVIHFGKNNIITFYSLVVKRILKQD